MNIFYRFTNTAIDANTNNNKTKINTNTNDLTNYKNNFIYQINKCEKYTGLKFEEHYPPQHLHIF